MMKWKRTALLLAVVCMGPRVVVAQSADTVRKFSLFGGAALTDNGATVDHFSQAEAGGSADFKFAAFPLTLRGTLAFIQQSPSFGTIRHFGTFSLDGIARPARSFFGIRPYGLVGLGVGTRAEFTSYATQYVEVDGLMVPGQTFAVPQPRLNWTFLEAGGGLEFGRLFIQAKIQQPVASNGVTRVPLSFGFRF